MKVNELAPPAKKDTSLIAVMGARYGVEPMKLYQALRETCFKAEPPLSNEELLAALVICRKYDMDPFLKEIHVTRSQGRLLVMVGVDGYLKTAKREIGNDGQSVYDGMSPPVFAYTEDGQLESCSVTVHRKDQGHPVTATCYLKEWSKGSKNWEIQPRHMLSIKAIKLALRLAFNISGFDMEEPEEVPFVKSTSAMPMALPQPIVEEAKEAREPGQEG